VRSLARIVRRYFVAGPKTRLSLRANFSWALTGNIVYNACQWGFIVALTKISSPEVVGRYAIAQAIVTPLFMLTNMRLNTVQVTDENSENLFGDYLGLRIICSLVAFILVVIILWAGGYGVGVISTAILIAFSKLIGSISDIVYGLMQKHERLDLVSCSLMFRGLLSLPVMTVTYCTLRSLPATLIAQFIVWSVILFGYDLPNARRWQSIRPLYHPHRWIDLFILGLPLGIVSGLNSLSAQMPRYALDLLAGRRELGVFAAIASLGRVSSLVVRALSNAALPRLAHLYAQDAPRHFVRLLRRLIGVGAVLGTLGVVIAVFWGRPFLTIVYTEEFEGYQSVLIVVMLSVGVATTFTFLGTAVAAARQFTVQVFAHAAKITAMGLACWVLVPRLGALGAAWASLVGALVSSLAYFIILQRAIQQAGVGLAQKVRTVEAEEVHHEEVVV